MLLPPSSKHRNHPLERHIQMFLLPPGEDAGLGARSGRAGTATSAAHLPAPPRVHTSLPRDDSDAEEDWLTLKAMSESLSSWEPLRDPDGDVVAGLDCRVPEIKENPSGTWEVGSALLVLALYCFAPSLPRGSNGEQELPCRILLRIDGIA